ncbi:hypothetical protein YB2330_006512 [Saitoella coloradoensis]
MAPGTRRGERTSRHKNLATPEPTTETRFLPMATPSDLDESDVDLSENSADEGSESDTENRVEEDTGSMQFRGASVESTDSQAIFASFKGLTGIYSDYKLLKKAFPEILSGSYEDWFCHWFMVKADYNANSESRRDEESKRKRAEAQRQKQQLWREKRQEEAEQLRVSRERRAFRELRNPQTKQQQSTAPVTSPLSGVAAADDEYELDSDSAFDGDVDLGDGVEMMKADMIEGVEVNAAAMGPPQRRLAVDLDTPMTTSTTFGAGAVTLPKSAFDPHMLEYDPDQRLPEHVDEIPVSMLTTKGDRQPSLSVELDPWGFGINLKEKSSKGVGVALKKKVAEKETSPAKVTSLKKQTKKDKSPEESTSAVQSDRIPHHKPPPSTMQQSTIPQGYRQPAHSVVQSDQSDMIMMMALGSDPRYKTPLNGPAPSALTLVTVKMTYSQRARARAQAQAQALAQPSTAPVPKKNTLNPLQQAVFKKGLTPAELERARSQEQSSINQVPPVEEEYDARMRLQRAQEQHQWEEEQLRRQPSQVSASQQQWQFQSQTQTQRQRAEAENHMHRQQEEDEAMRKAMKEAEKAEKKAAKKTEKKEAKRAEKKAQKKAARQAEKAKGKRTCEVAESSSGVVASSSSSSSALVSSTTPPLDSSSTFPPPVTYVPKSLQFNLRHNAPASMTPQSNMVSPSSNDASLPSLHNAIVYVSPAPDNSTSIQGGSSALSTSSDGRTKNYASMSGPIGLKTATSKRRPLGLSRPKPQPISASQIVDEIMGFQSSGAAKERKEKREKRERRERDRKASEKKLMADAQQEQVEKALSQKQAVQHFTSERNATRARLESGIEARYHNLFDREMIEVPASSERSMRISSLVD